MRRVSVVLIAGLALAACNKKAEPAKTQGAPMGANQVAKMPAMMPPGGQAAAEGGEKITAKVLEKIDAAGYSYLKLSEDQWAAVPQTDTAVGAEVTVVVSMHMDGFESPALKRKFDKLVFATLAGGAPAAGAQMPAGHPAAAGEGAAAANPAAGMPAHPAPTAIEETGPIKVTKAEGAEGRTVAEVWAQKDALKGKEVAVRGKIVKFTGGVMGKNWVHVRDGSGAEGKDNDLVVVTTDVAAKGDVVLVKGKLDTNRNLGAGYSFEVLVDDAKLAK